MAGYLLIGLVTSIVGHVFCKLPVEFFATYVLGIGGVTGSFAYGNSREHKFSQPSELTKPQG